MVVYSNNQLAPRLTSSAADENDFKSTTFIREIEKQMSKDGETYVKKVKGIIGFRVLGEGGKEIKWVIDAKNGSGSLELNSNTKPDCIITMKDGDLVDLMSGKLNPNTAFFNGKLKISGNMGVAMKIQSIMPAKAKL